MCPSQSRCSHGRCIGHCWVGLAKAAERAEFPFPAWNKHSLAHETPGSDQPDQDILENAMSWQLSMLSNSASEHVLCKQFDTLS